ncbi:MAG TPA: histone deacetylase [candidate division Zixibacteria bacterium]|nr:histone deacetylase [candidate division Zixibacteria bacterium]MDD4917350.1 histone deacetylase [candidate division Zixibacteria bacterium]MDM7971908.1 histone deacetylase [candidate division Zixibacteria bacterium]HOD66258.1 histone deacetylase [candidate division Zixibacteria bacterium]HOZ06953.1 histone deacetylase [candidate division Zixibacteria bacterium]
MRLIFHPTCLTYHLPGHPETPRRVRLAWEHLSRQYETVPPEPAGDEDILTVHTPRHLEMVRTGQFLDWDTPALPFIFDHALLAAGGALTAMRLALDGVAAISLLRPPGHHAGPDSVAGFCYFNNIAIAAARALEQVDRVAIVDFDCHHGNGTQDIFLGRDRVVYLSLHQSPFYPGTGLFSERNCFNYPLRMGADEEMWLRALDDGLAKVRAFGPDLIAVSAGFDLYKLDPFSFIPLSHEAFRAAGERIGALGRPVFSVLEGGYSDGLGRCAAAYLEGLAG